MYRYVPAVVLWLFAAGAWQYNSTHRNTKLLIPGIDQVPAWSDSLHMQGNATVGVLAGAGVLLFLIAGFTSFSDYRKSKKPKL